MLWLLASALFGWLTVRELRAPQHPLHPEPIYPPYLLLVFALTIGCAWPPLNTWRFERRLERVASVLADGKRAHVHCNTLFDTMMDPESLAAGYAIRDTGRITLQKPWCSVLQSYLRDPQHTDVRERYSLLVLTHEAMHVRGELNEARAQCQAMQRLVMAGRLLGVPEAIVRRDAHDFVTNTYPLYNKPGSFSAPYWSAQCAPGGEWDEHLPDSPWTAPLTGPAREGGQPNLPHCRGGARMRSWCFRCRSSRHEIPLPCPRPVPRARPAGPRRSGRRPVPGHLRQGVDMAPAAVRWL